MANITAPIVLDDETCGELQELGRGRGPERGQCRLRRRVLRSDANREQRSTRSSVQVRGYPIASSEVSPYRRCSTTSVLRSSMTSSRRTSALRPHSECPARTIWVGDLACDRPASDLNAPLLTQQPRCSVGSWRRLQRSSAYRRRPRPDLRRRRRRDSVPVAPSQAGL